MLVEQARKFRPDSVVIADESKYAEVREALEGTDVKVYAGADAVAQVVTLPNVELVLTAMVGYSGLRPTVEAVKAGKDIALANKETLVVAGELVTRLVEEHRVAVLPVDSEHSAIFQCLAGERARGVEKLILTASGGPFRGRTREELRGVTPEEALRHPNWKMGAKVTIDSASMMNKGFEVMEARWLFGMPGRAHRGGCPSAVHRAFDGAVYGREHQGAVGRAGYAAADTVCPGLSGAGRVGLRSGGLRDMRAIDFRGA